MNTNLIMPKGLKIGDAVALIAPSGPVGPARLEAAVQAARRLGLKPVAGPSCRAAYGYLAGGDALRAADVNWAFSQRDLRGVFCVRGGYGAGRILNSIDYDAIRRDPKIFCGYSDITALHIAINQRAGVATFHTPMLGDELDDYSMSLFRQCLFAPQTILHIQNPPGAVLAGGGDVKGVLCGGNLSVAASLTGTPFELDTTGKILFLEDIGEEPYRIDRMLNQLHLSGAFARCTAVVFGDFADCEPKNPEKSLTLEAIIHNLRLDVPVLTNLRCGHCMPTASLPLGAEVFFHI